MLQRFLGILLRNRLPRRSGRLSFGRRFCRWLPVWLGLLPLLLLAGPAPAVERVKVMALFSGKAMVSIDGKKRVLTAGRASPEGVLLVSADSKGAVIEVNGRRESYQLGSDYGGNFAEPSLAQARIARNNRGGYTTVGSINGRNVTFLVDTGASSVAFSSVEAKRLGIPYRLEGRPIGVSTASGYARGYAVKLDKVQVGEIELANVDGLVIEGSSPKETLLGMTFLNRVKLEDRGNLLILQTKY